LLLSERAKSPLTPLLKKHVVGSTLTGVKRLGGDRIIMLNFSRGIAAGITAERVLLCELTGRHNDLILLGGDGLIISTGSSDPPALRGSREHLINLQCAPSPNPSPGVPKVPIFIMPCR